MSIERFVEDYPAGYFFPYFVRSEIEFVNGGNVRSLAQLFIRQGRKGLQELNRHAGDRRTDQLSPKEAVTFRQNSAAIFWGSLFPVLETLIVDGIYEPKTLISNQDAGFMGVGWKPDFEIDPEAFTTISGENQKQLRAFAQQDKSLTGFIYSPFIKILPQELYTVIENSHLLPDLINYIGPEFRKRALLLSPPRKEASSVAV